MPTVHAQDTTPLDKVSKPNLKIGIVYLRRFPNDVFFRYAIVIVCELQGMTSASTHMSCPAQENSSGGDNFQNDSLAGSSHPEGIMNISWRPLNLENFFKVVFKVFKVEFYIFSRSRFALIHVNKLSKESILLLILM